MTRLTTIKAPLTDGKTRDVSGRVALLYVGAYRRKFLLQETPHGETFLTHFASGRTLGSLTPVKLRAMRQHRRITDRQAAIELIATLVDQHGADAVNAKLDAAKVLN